MSYTFQPDSAISRVYYVTSGGSVTSRIATQGATAYDFFPDTGVAVGDYLQFGVKTSYGSGTYIHIVNARYHGIIFDIGTALVATAITGIWEYASTPTVAGTLVWSALTNVRDDTNSFQNTGVNTVTWELPSDWSNRNVPSSGIDFYMWYVRFRVTAVTTLTEGGRQNASFTKIISRCLKITDQAGTTLNDVYTQDKAGTLTLDSRSVTAVDGATITFKNFLAPADYVVLGGAAQDLYITVTSFTGVGNVTVQIAGTDISGAAQTEDITFSANGTYYATKYFKTLITSQVTAFAPTSCTYAVIQGQWGFSWKLGNTQYAFDANICHTGTTGFSSIDEQVTFLKASTVRFKGSGTYAFGSLYSADKFYASPDWVFEASSADYSSTEIGPSGTATFYGLRVRCLTTGSGLASQGFWGSNIGTSTGHTVYGLFADRWRQLDFRSNSNSIIGATIYGGHVEQCSAGNMANITSYADATSQICFREINAETVGNNKYIHQSDVSLPTGAGVNIWQEQDVDQFNLYCVDFIWGSLTETSVAPYKVTWNISSSVTYQTQSVWEVYSLLQKLVDRYGNAVQTATVNIYDNTGTNVLSCQTTSDGYLNSDNGTVTSSTSTTLVDSTKSWSTSGYGEWGYHEVYITSGTGAGQRRFVMASNNTATTLKITPAWSVNPSTDSKYIIIPYISVKKFVPHVFTPSANPYSDVTNLGPHRLVIQKSGFNMIDDKITIDGPINGVIPMTRSRLEL